ncbi:AarF/UbiB family protein [Legionella oakridgensis]|uniref:AarF/UbiB family protein n=1 Tax=Legionella oakridgensis TaxID=29423 RepID=UPI0003DE072D|nr:AarF/UbiB family protein [Legionella oakridgensis]ETO93978.1 putative unusual protein kinase [Legionella oakridgensis RV-2-2007]
MTIQINSTNVAQNEWIWDFLESQRLLGKSIWHQGEKFTYNGTDYTFQQIVFARQRKDPKRGYAYEMLSSEQLGRGAYGAIYRVACTISLGKNGHFQAQNKHRVAKYQSHRDALYEFQSARFTDHLHVKVPNQGLMVMREIPGQTLHRFLLSTYLTRAEKLELTKALLNAFKEQVVDRNLIHNDLHQGNILVHVDNQGPRKQFIINVVDYGLANFNPTLYLNKPYTDIANFLSLTIQQLWSSESDWPTPVAQLLNSNSSSLTDYITFFNEAVASPNPQTQKPLESMLAYLKELEKTHQELASRLKSDLLEAVEHSSSNDVDLLKEAIQHCKESLVKAGIKLDTFPYPIFTNNPQKQQLFNEIYAYFQLLENKGKALMATSHKREGEQLCALVHQLRERTFNAHYLPPEKQKSELVECGNTCKRLLQENQHLLDIHRNTNYIWAEVSVIFCSLIVLYPIIAGIHYAATGRFTFFAQTESAQGATKMEKDFNQLNSIAVF